MDRVSIVRMSADTVVYNNVCSVLNFLLKFHIQLPIVILAAEEIIDRLFADRDDFQAIECVALADKVDRSVGAFENSGAFVGRADDNAGQSVGGQYNGRC